MEEDRLKAGLAAGEKSSYQTIYDLYGPAMYRAAARMLGNTADAEDAVQEVFVSLVRSRRWLAGAKDLKAYLFVSLHRTAGRIGRRSRQRQMACLQEPQAKNSTPDGDFDVEAMRGAVKRLPDQQRNVIALKIDGELTFAQISEILNINHNTAVSRYRYAIERLKSMLGSGK